MIRKFLKKIKLYSVKTRIKKDDQYANLSTCTCRLEEGEILGEAEALQRWDEDCLGLVGERHFGLKLRFLIIYSYFRKCIPA